MINEQENLIKISHIRKTYGQKVALKDIDLNIKKGEILGLLGPSGAGKTTLIKILTGQIAQSEGFASLFKQDCRNLTEENYDNIGMVLDNSGVYSRLSVIDNLIVFTDIFNIDRARIMDVLRDVDLIDARKTLAGDLSKGMRQRLIFARAILHKPKLLFLDEPTSGLDPVTSKKIHDLIFKLKSDGTTVFLTTHDMVEATKLCDNVALLNEGTIVEYGSPKEICEKYNKDNNIIITLKNGEKVSYPNNKDSAALVAKHIENEEIVTMHSSEPTLESVFINITGKELI